MDKIEIEKIIKLRTNLIERFNSLRDYKNNPNAIMKERDHAQYVHSIVVALDDLLKEHVKFSK